MLQKVLQSRPQVLVCTDLKAGSLSARIQKSAMQALLFLFISIYSKHLPVSSMHPELVSV